MKSFASQAAWTLVFNYFDNFIGVSPPTLATSHFHEFEELLHHLGLEESAAKWVSNSILWTLPYLLIRIV